MDNKNCNLRPKLQTCSPSLRKEAWYRRGKIATQHWSTATPLSGCRTRTRFFRAPLP